MKAGPKAKEIRRAVIDASTARRGCEHIKGMDVFRQPQAEFKASTSVLPGIFLVISWGQFFEVSSMASAHAPYAKREPLMRTVVSASSRGAAR